MGIYVVAKLCNATDIHDHFVLYFFKKKKMDCDMPPVLVGVSLAGKTVRFSVECVCSFESDKLCWAYC